MTALYGDWTDNQVADALRETRQQLNSIDDQIEELHRKAAELGERELLLSLERQERIDEGNEDFDYNTSDSRRSYQGWAEKPMNVNG